MQNREFLESQNSLKTQVLHWIRQCIFRGDFPPGSLISALGIAKRFRAECGMSASRSPVREAMENLAHDGLIQWKGNAGAEVQTISHRRLLDILQLRYAVEVQVVQRLGQEHCPRALEQLRALLLTAKTAKEKSVGAADTGTAPKWHETRWTQFELDRQFHVHMAKLADMEYACAVISRQMDHFLLFACTHVGSFGDPAGEHEEIVQAIESYDDSDMGRSNAAVRRAVRNHMVQCAERWEIRISPEVKRFD